MTRALLPWIAAPVLAAAGFALWAAFALSLTTGRADLHEAWDSDAYWSFGLPLFLAAMLAAGFVVRGRPALLAAFAVAGHFLGMLLLAKPGTSLGLLPLSFAFIGLPMFLALAAAAWVGARVRELVK
jgi:hypothetical protein